MAGEKKPGDGTLGEKEMGILKTLLKFAVTLLLVPIVSYFVIKTYVFEMMLGYENASIHSVVFTVIMIHIIVGVYIWTAVAHDRSAKVALNKKD